MEASRREFLGISAATAALASGLAPAVAAAAANSAPASSAKDKFWVAAVTPCDRNYKFDEGAYRDQLSWWKENGADGVLVLGTNGEGPSFSVAERKHITEFALKNKMGLDMIVATGTPNYHEAIELSRHAADHGADSVLIQPPFYYKNPQGEGVIDYFRLVFDEVKTPVRYYHIPKVTGVPVDATVFKALAQHPNFVGVKDSNGDPAEYEAIVAAVPSTLNIISGTDNNMLAALSHGNGVILGSGNVYTKLVAAIFTAHRAGKDVNEPMARLTAATQMMQANGYGSNYNAVKLALNQMMGGSRMTYARPPHVALSDEQIAKIRAGVSQLKAMA
jgi:4-hydroxy-tetrahydrodipicolinate synthase